MTDTAILDWLNAQPVDVIYLDDGTIIDVRGLDVRAAICAHRDAGNHELTTEPQQPDLIAPTRACLAADEWADEAIDIAQRSRNEDWRQAERHAGAVLRTLAGLKGEVEL